MNFSGKLLRKKEEGPLVREEDPESKVTF